MLLISKLVFATTRTWLYTWSVETPTASLLLWNLRAVICVTPRTQRCWPVVLGSWIAVEAPGSSITRWECHKITLDVIWPIFAKHNFAFLVRTFTLELIPVMFTFWNPRSMWSARKALKLSILRISILAVTYLTCSTHSSTLFKDWAIHWNLWPCTVFMTSSWCATTSLRFTLITMVRLFHAVPQGKEDTVILLTSPHLTFLILMPFIHSLQNPIVVRMGRYARFGGLLLSIHHCSWTSVYWDSQRWQWRACSDCSWWTCSSDTLWRHKHIPRYPWLHEPLIQTRVPAPFPACESYATN